MLEGVSDKFMLKLEMIPALWAGAPKSRKMANGVPCTMRDFCRIAHPLHKLLRGRPPAD